MEPGPFPRVLIFTCRADTENSGRRHEPTMGKGRTHTERDGEALRPFDGPQSQETPGPALFPGCNGRWLIHDSHTKIARSGPRSTWACPGSPGERIDGALCVQYQHADYVLRSGGGKRVQPRARGQSVLSKKGKKKKKKPWASKKRPINCGVPPSFLFRLNARP